MLDCHCSCAASRTPVALSGGASPDHARCNIFLQHRYATGATAPHSAHNITAHAHFPSPTRIALPHSPSSSPIHSAQQGSGPRPRAQAVDTSSHCKGVPVGARSRRPRPAVVLAWWQIRWRSRGRAHGARLLPPSVTIAPTTLTTSLFRPPTPIPTWEQPGPAS